MRTATAARLGVGAACLGAPRHVLAVIDGPDRADRTTHRVARILGGRLVLQAVADLALGRRTRGVGAVVDLTHAASMLPVAARWPVHRRTALTSAVLAAGIGLLDLRGDTPGSRVPWG